MPALAVISYRDTGFRTLKIQRSKTGLDDEIAYISTEWRRRCASSCIARRDLAVEGKKASPRKSSNIRRLRTWDENNHALIAAQSSSLTTVPVLPIKPPPSYNESIADAPPSYDSAEQLATARILHKPEDSPASYVCTTRNTICPPEFMPKTDIDLDDTSTFKQAGGKKAKKQAGAANKPAWADDGEDGSKGGGEGGEDNDGVGGGSNNGDGGAGGDGGGGGGDNWNDWADTGKKKKGKKGKKEQEEEEKKKKEEEEEEEAAAAGEPKLDWADDANGDLGDDWGGFSTTAKKKDKKDKKGKVEEKPTTTSNFDDISLDDTPQIELSFGSTKDKKDTGFGSSFGGGWNPSSWGTGNDWSFSGADAGTTDIANSFSKDTKDTKEPAADSGVWNFGGNKKGNKKKTTSTGFDFGDLGGLDEEKEDEEKKEEPKADDWGAGFTSFGKKDKKPKKKSAWDDTPVEADPDTIGTALADPEPIIDNTWGTTAAKKKKGKKGEEEPAPPPPPPPPAAVEPPVDDFVGFGTKKIKKGGKKIMEVVEDPIITIVPEAEPEADTSGWGSFGKKDKKKVVKKEPEKIEEFITALPEPEPEPEVESAGWGSLGKKDKKKAGKKEEKLDDPNIAVVEEPEPVVGGWGSIGKKEKKKFGKKEADKVSEPDVSKIVEPEVKPNDDWAAFSTKKDKDNDKDKRKKKSIWDEPDKEEPVVEEVEPVAETGWGAFGSKTKKKPGKKDIVEDFPPPPPEPEPVTEEKPTLSRTGSKKDKKGKKGLISEVKDEPSPAADTRSVADDKSVAADEDWGSNWGGTDKKKDKKSKRNFIASSAGTKEDAALPPPPVPDVPDASSFDIWGTASKKEKDKKGKKGKAAEPEIEVSPDLEPDVSRDLLDDDFGADTWGISAEDKKRKEEEEKEEAEWAASIKGLSLKERKKKEKDRDKAKKEKEEAEAKAKQEEEERINREEDERKKEEDEWAASIKGLPIRERKKKEKEREKAKKDKEENEKREREDEEERVRFEEEAEKAAEEEAKANKKGKLGKKGKTSTSPVVSKTKDLLADSVPDTDPIVEANTWGSSWGIGKNDKKKGGKSVMDWEVPPAAPTPPAQGLTPDAEEDDPIVDWGDYGTTATKSKSKKNSTVEDSKVSKKGVKGAKNKIEEVIEEKESLKDDVKKKDTFMEEMPAKAAKSFWGGTGATTTTTVKSKKGKDAEPEEDPDEIVEILDEEPEAPKKSSKDKTGSKLSKATTKESDKASKSTDAKKKGITDEADDAPAAKGKDGKSKGLGVINKKDKDDTTTGAGDAFTSSLWGSGSSTKKTSGKKADEGKKEIGKPDLTNQKASVNKGAWNEPEATSEETDDQPAATPATKTSKTKATMSTTKPTKLSPVQQKIRDLEKKRQEAAGEIAPPPPPVVDPEPPTLTKKEKEKEKGLAAKSKDSAIKTTSSKSKDLSPVDKKKPSKDSVPGSFPGMDDLDDMLDVDSTPLEKKESKKSTKSSAKDTIKASKTRETPESKRPPTPPPEPKEEKPVKKERARVSKSLWGAPVVKKEVKKETKAKDDADISPPPQKEKNVAPGLSRSKSTKTTVKEKELARSDPTDSDMVEEKAEKPKKADSRPPKSRGSSFGGLFGGGPPKRTQSTRRNSTISAPKTRESIDVGDSGLPSPPADDRPVTGKAAKLMGVGASKLDRKASTRGKQKVSGKDLEPVHDSLEATADKTIPAAPDPYAIDSDDMVMVNPVEDPIINAKPPKKGSKSKVKNDVAPEPVPLTRDLPDRTKSKRDSKVEPSSSKRKSKAVNDFDDDVVMVDAGPSDETEAIDGPDDMQFITKPKGLQRLATSAKKPESKKGGLFGAFRKSRRASETNEQPKSRAVVEDEEVTPRKRTVTGGDDSAKRPRRDDRRKSEKLSSRAAEGYVYDTAGDAGATEAEEADARREERRSKRADKDRIAKEAQDEALKYEAERRSKRREAEKSKLKDERDRKARKEEEAEARRAEEKDSRRAARESRRAKEEEQANRELENDILKPRIKRRDTDKEASSRPGKSDRRKSHMDKPIPSIQTPDDEEARRARREERRGKPSRRKSTAAAAAAPVDDYFDPRNGGTNPYGENDHTASWVKSQVSEPPEPPPLEPTIMEPPPDLRAGNGGEDLLAEENLRRSSHRKSKRSSRMYTDPIIEDQETRSRRKESRVDGRGVRSSEGSAEGERYAVGRRQSDLGGVKLGAGQKTYDGRTGQGKRSSWFQKITGK